MSNITRLDKIIQHFTSPETYPLTDDLAEYMDQLDYCRDLMKRYGYAEIWKMLARKYSFSRATAYNLITDTRNFFTLHPLEKSGQWEFWRNVSIERHEHLYKLQLEAAETTKDYDYCRKTLERLDKLRGEGQKDNKPDEGKPAVVVLALPGGNVVDINSINLPDMDKVIDLVENVGFTVEDMRKELTQDETE